MPGGQRGGEPPASAAVAARAEQTRAALIGAARELFIERGYHATTTEDIVKRADVGTRGALYHHFADKRALFVAVFETVEEDLVEAAAASVVEGPPLEILRAGLLGFLDAAVNPQIQRILLVDGPGVLGWQQWRAIEARYGLGGIRGMLELAAADGSLTTQPLDALAHLLLASVAEGALFIANSSDPATARNQAIVAMDALLSGLRHVDT